MPRFTVTCIVIAAAVVSGVPCAGGKTSAKPSANRTPRDPAVPTIDEMGTDWLDVSRLVHMPSLHNFHEMGACSANLLGVNYNPGGQLYGGSGPRWYRYRTLPLVKLMIDGKGRESTSCRWQPHQAVRRTKIDGLTVETTVRMVFEGPGILYRIKLTNAPPKQRTVDLAIEVPGAKTAAAPGDAVLYRSARPALSMAHVFVQKPDQLEAGDKSVTGRWKLNLAGGASRTLELVMAHDAAGAQKTPHPSILQAVNWAGQFERTWSDAKSRWAQRWSDAFTPGNKHFSGHLPVLVTSDAKLREIYYRSVLTLLVLHRTNLAKCNRVFITSGERAKGVVYFWDTSMWSKIFALLEPNGLKQHLRLFLRANPHRGPVYNMNAGRQSAGWYAANDMAIFRLTYNYLAVTGDEAFLNEKIGDRTVLEHLAKLATNWQVLQKDKSVMLADYGVNRNLLECAPAYVHRVPSFNAANVWMMRAVADMYDQRRDAAKGRQLRQWADQIAKAVLGLYKPGDGVWHALHRDGKRVQLRHCYDFFCIGRFMSDDLTEKMKKEMVAFVERELLTAKWMRAMSLKDQAAKLSDRPDHGPMGAFDAWPALTAEAMCRLGAWDAAVKFTRRTQAALYEGVYAQAHELYGQNRTQYGAPVRIAMRRGCMRECVGGGAFAEMVVGALFGYGPAWGRDLQLLDRKANRGFQGRLLNVRYRNQLLDITGKAKGVTFRKHK